MCEVTLNKQGFFHWNVNELLTVGHDRLVCPYSDSGRQSGNFVLWSSKLRTEACQFGVVTHLE